MQNLEKILHDRGNRLRVTLGESGKLLFSGEPVSIVIVSLDDLSDFNLRVIFYGQVSNNIILFNKLLKLLKILIVVLGKL